MRVTYKGIEYKVGYNREAAVKAENEGFSLESVQRKPVTAIPILVYHAFAAYNRKIKRSLVDEIFQNIGDKEGFVLALIDQYAECVNSLMSDEGEESGDEGKNATWTVD